MELFCISASRAFPSASPSAFKEIVSGDVPIAVVSKVSVASANAESCRLFKSVAESSDNSNTLTESVEGVTVWMSPKPKMSSWLPNVADTKDNSSGSNPRFTSYVPNEGAVPAPSPSILIVTDAWVPGETCRADGVTVIVVAAADV